MIQTTQQPPATDQEASPGAPPDHPAETDIVVRNLAKTYDGQDHVLHDINFDIHRGQAVSLIGHNGSGKSTLLRCCLRLVEPTGGTIRLFGEEITESRRKRVRGCRCRVGFIFQRHNLVPRLSVLTNVLHGAQARRSGPRVWYHSLARQNDREEALACLERVGLAHLAKRRADQLSGGESQRVAIARALMQRPKLLMADEPAASLDPSAGDEVMQLFRDLCREEGLTLVFVSHNLEHALKYGERILGLRDGRLELNTLAETEDVSSLRGLYD
jgi:phosphonate transport system ATP-binding protein